MKNASMMVMPPIYRFNLEGFPKESSWGWHKASDVVTAVNNILVLEQDCQPLSPEKINEEFPFVTLNKKQNTNIFSPSFGGSRSPVAHPDTPFGITTIGEIHWLKTATEGGYYIPAKLGIQLIDAAKHPMKSAIKRTFK